MDKKDIYQHLANIYLDVSAKGKKKETPEYLPNIFKNLFFISIIVIFALTIFIFSIQSKKESIFTNLNKNRPINSELALVLQPDIVKINFNFEPAKKEIFAINLNKLDLRHFKTLGFSIRKANYQDNIILKVEFTNVLNEKSEIYLNDIPAYKWRDYKINFSEFKNISVWSEMSNLSFIIEEWNTKEKRGVVYLDNVRFLR